MSPRAADEYPAHVKEARIRTKLIQSPRKLVEALDRAVGPDTYTIHMRHNTYRIKASKAIDVPGLLASVSSVC
ncbi:hypothetical protein QBC34DRAFT_160857 [Podospora aff. communis PSN243]|uniref:Uncharacterized protein n=1 Tax=Podospora aff. communis PSN243 TaxID=3040156 RepID=A0AAV9GEG0_9PEZI|nr:hypothetical protein QBC34DRAFT_160857 [Podospora aff. communis PSN243]